MSKKAWSGIVVSVIVVLIIAWFVILKPSGTTAVQIGGIYALTGKAASFGKWVKNGVDLATDEINRSGGINGRALEVVSEDTQSDPKQGVSAFEKLIAINKIFAAVGFITSSEALACAPVAERAKIVMITPIAGTPKLKDAGDFVFRTRESGLLQSYKIAEYIYEDLKISEAGVLCENAANAVGYRDAFIERFEALGGKVTPSLTYDEGQTDFRSVLTLIKGANPPLLYIPGVGKVIGRVLKQAAELGLETRFFSSAGIEDPELFRIAGEAANGVIYGAPDFSLASDDQYIRSFTEAYRKRFGEDPSVYAANAYDAVMLLAAAMRAGSKTGESIRDFLYSTHDYRGASGILTFDTDGEVQKPIILKQTVEGSFLRLRPVVSRSED